MSNFLISLLIYYPLVISIEYLFGLDFKLNYIYMIFILIIIIESKKMSAKEWVNLIFMILTIIIISYLNNKNILYSSIVDYINILLIFKLVVTLGITYIEKCFFDRRKTIKMMINFLIILNIIYFISPYGWDFIWDGMQFKSIYKFPHDACYMFITLQVYCILLYNINKKTYYIFGVMIFCIFALFTNSRTPFFMSAFISFYFLYKKSTNKVELIYIFIFCIILFLSFNYYFNFIDINNIPIINKFIRGKEIGNITSSRNIIWDNVFGYYKEDTTIVSKLFGSGFGSSRVINEYYMHESLWSHNDFLEILVSGGIVQLLYYIINFNKVLFKSNSLLFMIIVYLIAFYNGFYVYHQIIFTIPLLILAINITRRKDEETS